MQRHLVEHDPHRAPPRGEPERKGTFHPAHPERLGHVLDEDLRARALASLLKEDEAARAEVMGSACAVTPGSRASSHGRRRRPDLDEIARAGEPGGQALRCRRRPPRSSAGTPRVRIIHAPIAS